MTTSQLVSEAMALPSTERATLAQLLWESLEDRTSEGNEEAAVRVAMQRDVELSSGSVVGRSHEEVMKAARRAIACV